MGVDDHIHGAQAVVARFDLMPDEDELPIVFVCPQAFCHTTVWMERVRVRRWGFVTCMVCMRPMTLLQDTTVH